jgi:hypothetical protein
VKRVLATAGEKAIKVPKLKAEIGRGDLLSIKEEVDPNIKFALKEVL